LANPNILTKREKDFALRVARGEDPVTAMVAAGYAASTARQNGAAFLLRREIVRQEIKRFKQIEATLVNEGPVDLSGFVPELQVVLASKPLTEKQVEELLKCADPKTGLIYWLKNYVWTWDKANKRKASYPLWPFQEEFLKELEIGGKILVEKSRDLMVTWTVCEYMLWHMQFDPFWSGLATSRNANEVDNGGSGATAKSIFGRIMFSWKHQPIWLRMDLKFGRLKITSDEEGMWTELNGEAATKDVGRSSDVYFKWGDEFSLVEQSEKAHASMVGGGFQTLLYTSTSNLTGNEFYRLRTRKDSGFRILHYLWSDRPDRDEAWYKDKTASMTAEQKAKELDIVYEVKGPRRIWKKFDPRLHVVQQNKIPIGVGFGVMGFDEGFASPGALYYARYWGRTLYVIDEVYKANVQLLNPESLRDDMDHDWVWYIDDLIKKHGEVAAIAVGFESRGFEAILTTRGHKVYRVNQDKRNRIRLVDGLFSGNGSTQPGILISDECADLLKEIPYYKWKTTPAGVMTDMPADSVDHAIDALQCIAEYALEEHAQENDEETWVSEL